MCNHFLERLNECYVTLNELSGHILLDTENIWEYVARKGIMMSKTVLILRSRDENLVDSEDDSLPTVCTLNNDAISPDAVSTLNDVGYSELIESLKRKICDTCACTYVGDCLRCVQNSQYGYSLQQDALRNRELDLFNGELTEK